MGNTPGTTRSERVEKYIFFLQFSKEYKRKEESVHFVLYAVAFVIKEFLYKQHNNIVRFKRQIECQIEC